MIEKLIWKDEYNTGIGSIDAQHKRLAEFTNRLIDAKGSDMEGDAFRTVLTEAVDYVREHFSYEEQILARYQYPRFEEHKKQHADFVKKVFKNIKDFESRDSFDTDALIDFFKTWLVHHILKSDRDGYGSFLMKKNVS